MSNSTTRNCHLFIKSETHTGRPTGSRTGHRGQPHPGCLRGLAGTFLLKQLTITQFAPQQVLLAGREQQSLSVQRADDIILDRAILQVIATHAPSHILLDHLDTDGRDGAGLGALHMLQNTPFKEQEQRRGFHRLPATSDSRDRWPQPQHTWEDNRQEWILKLLAGFRSLGQHSCLPSPVKTSVLAGKGDNPGWEGYSHTGG